MSQNRLWITVAVSLAASGWACEEPGPTLQMLIIGLLFGATFRMAGSSSRRLLATSMAARRGQRLAGVPSLSATPQPGARFGVGAPAQV